MTRSSAKEDRAVSGRHLMGPIFHILPLILQRWSPKGASATGDFHECWTPPDVTRCVTRWYRPDQLWSEVVSEMEIASVIMGISNYITTAFWNRHLVPLKSLPNWPTNVKETSYRYHNHEHKLHAHEYLITAILSIREYKQRTLNTRNNDIQT